MDNTRITSNQQNKITKPLPSLKDRINFQSSKQPSKEIIPDVSTNPEVSKQRSITPTLQKKESQIVNTNLKTQNNPNKDKTLKEYIKPVEEVKVIAEKFASKIRSLDNVSSVSSSAKMKLMEMRFSKTNTSISENEFNDMMKEKPYSLNFKNAIGEINYIFSPDKILQGLEDFKFGDTVHKIKDNSKAYPPTLSKVADLQEFLEIIPNGVLDEHTFKTLLEKYEKALFSSDNESLVLLEKLMAVLFQRIGTQHKFGKLIKGFLLAKTIIVASEQGKFGGFEKMNLMLDEYLPDIIKTKLRIRLRLIRKIHIALQSSPNDKSIKLNLLIKDEINNLSAKDKIKILNAYFSLFPAIRETDAENQLLIIKSLVGFKIDNKERDLIKNLIERLMKYFKLTGHNQEEHEAEQLYNRIKLHVLSQVI